MALVETVEVKKCLSNGFLLCGACGWSVYFFDGFRGGFAPAVVLDVFAKQKVFC